MNNLERNRENLRKKPYKRAAAMKAEKKVKKPKPARA